MAASEPENPALVAWLASVGPMRPFAVSIPKTQELLGDKCRSGIYAAAGDGLLDLIKDGAKTLVTVDSIIRYYGKMRPAQIKPSPPRNRSTSARSRRQRGRQVSRANG